jgi:hypothetical protein
MGLSDGSYRSMPAFHQVDLAQTLIKAYYGSIDGYNYPTADDFETIYSVKYADEWSEAFLFGDWSRAAKKLSDYKGIRVEMEDDSYVGKLQVKVYGDKTGQKNNDGSDKYYEQYVQLASGSNITEATFDTSTLGSTFWGVTLQTQLGALTAKVKKATLIKADGSEFSLSVTSAWGCTVATESTPKTSGIHSVQINKANADDVIYNLQGQRIAKPQKGIYIQNGKKLIAK